MIGVTQLEKADGFGLMYVADDLGRAETRFREAADSFGVSANTVAAGTFWTDGGQQDAVSVMHVNGDALTIGQLRMQAAKNAVQAFGSAVTTAQSRLHAALEDAAASKVVVSDDGTAMPSPDLPVSTNALGDPDPAPLEDASRIQREVRGILAFATLADACCRDLLTLVTNGAPSVTTTADPALEVANAQKLESALNQQDLAMQNLAFWEGATPQPLELENPDFWEGMADIGIGAVQVWVGMSPLSAVGKGMQLISKGGSSTSLVAPGSNANPKGLSPGTLEEHLFVGVEKVGDGLVKIMPTEEDPGSSQTAPPEVSEPTANTAYAAPEDGGAWIGSGLTTDQLKAAAAENLLTPAQDAAAILDDPETVEQPVTDPASPSYGGTIYVAPNGHALVFDVHGTFVRYDELPYPD